MKPRKDNGIVSEHLARPNELKSNPRWKTPEGRKGKYFCYYFYPHNHSLKKDKVGTVSLFPFLIVDPHLSLIVLFPKPQALSAGKGPADHFYESSCFTDNAAGILRHKRVAQGH